MRGLGGEGGGTVIYVAMVLAVLVALSGLALDPGRAWLYRARLQAAADSAALAGARQANEEISMDYHGNVVARTVWVDPARAETAARQTFAMNTDWTDADSSITLSGLTVTSGARDLTLQVAISMKTVFMRVLGFETLSWSTTATAEVR